MAQLIVRLKDREMQRVSVTGVATRIGRNVSNDVVINNDGISRHHATLRYDAGERVFVIHDASSANGIMVRGRVTPEARLADGDEVQVGKFTLVFLEGGGVPPEELGAEELAPEPRASAPSGAVRNPLPTTTVRPVTRPRVAGLRPSAAGSATASDASATASQPPAFASTPPSLVSRPPANDPADERLASQIVLLRRVTVLLVVVVVLLALLIGLLLGRR